MSIWSKISYDGTYALENDADKRTVDLTNRLIYFGAIVVGMYIPILYFMEMTTTLYISIVIFLLYGVLFFISKLGRHRLTVYALVIVLILYIVSLSTIELLMETKLLSSTIHLFLVIVGLFGITLMKTLKSAFVVVIMIILSFFAIEAIKYKSNFVPNEFQTSLFVLYVINVFTLFLSILHCIYHFKLVSLDYSNHLSEQKVKLQSQNQKLEDVRFEIEESITYAKKIQAAILPTGQLVEDYFKESFIFYKPKDIVAGDFYWTEELENHVLFAVADCTGHGVPGALVSVVCNNALNRSVREFKLTDTGQILDKAREIIIKEFEKSEENVYDGMDIALIKIPLNTDSKNGIEIEYSGANNPLWIVRENELLEYKPSKQPVGKFKNLTPFNTCKLSLYKNDNMYIFSDGFVDQFGGEKGKKFKPANFRKLLLSINNMSMQEQRQCIREAFFNWKGMHDQVDDICLIGVKI